MVDYELQFYLATVAFTNINKPIFFTISREIRSRGTWDQAHCCFLIFSYILILFLEKNRFCENFEISWAIDFAVFAFWMKQISSAILFRRGITLDCFNLATVAFTNKNNP
ncbi:hypothetical protein Tsp_05435, partial [Trichinella spiralis]|uniref:hypothetical protein n=1 Tax=Trichinella spiralis TaxID=6334 RepID=UPI0001EFD764